MYVEISSGVEWSGVEWSGVEWRGVEWSGVEWSGVEWSGVEWSGVEWSEVEWSGVEWSGCERAVGVISCMTTSLLRGRACASQTDSSLWQVQRAPINTTYFSQQIHFPLSS